MRKGLNSLLTFAVVGSSFLVSSCSEFFNIESYDGNNARKPQKAQNASGNGRRGY